MEEVKDEVLPVEDEAVDQEQAEVNKEQTAPEKPQKPGFGAKLKEWNRKNIVNLKRKPQRISFYCYVICAVFYLIALFTFSKGASAVAAKVKVSGILIFVSTLLSILVLVSFLNAFPNRKKPVIAMIVLVFVMSAAIVACDLALFIQVLQATQSVKRPYTETAVYTSLPLYVVHLVLLVISMVLFALTPVIHKMLLKINTQIEIESNDIKDGENLIIDE